MHDQPSRNSADVNSISLGQALDKLVLRAGIQMRMRQENHPVVSRIDAIWDDVTLSAQEQEQAVDALLRQEGLK